MSANKTYNFFHRTAYLYGIISGIFLNFDLLTLLLVFRNKI